MLVDHQTAGGTNNEKGHNCYFENYFEEKPTVSKVFCFATEMLMIACI